jgi:outer membrane cobalamin receptor
MRSKEPTWTDIKKIITGWSDKQLIGLVQDLYRLNPDNAAFLNARLLQQSAPKQALAPYKERIQQAVSPREPWKQDVRLSEGRKAISDFKKANGNAKNTLSLMVYYVQCGNDFTLEFGDIDEGFYNSMCSMVRQIRDRLLKEQDRKLTAEFLPILEGEFQRIDGQMGWGYADEFGEYVEDIKKAFNATDR